MRNPIEEMQYRLKIKKYMRWASVPISLAGLILIFTQSWILAVGLFIFAFGNNLMLKAEYMRVM